MTEGEGARRRLAGPVLRKTYRDSDGSLLNDVAILGRSSRLANIVARSQQYRGEFQVSVVVSSWPMSWCASDRCRGVILANITAVFRPIT